MPDHPWDHRMVQGYARLDLALRLRRAEDGRERRAGRADVKVNHRTLHYLPAAQAALVELAGAARATGLVMKKMQGKLDGTSLRVPIPDGSITDFTGVLKKDAGRAYQHAAASVRVDDLVQRDTCLLKADVEGYEPMVCDGATELLATSPSLIVSEYIPFRVMAAMGLNSSQAAFDAFFAHFPPARYNASIVYYQKHADASPQLRLRTRSCCRGRGAACSTESPRGHAQAPNQVHRSSKNGQYSSNHQDSS